MRRRMLLFVLALASCRPASQIVMRDVPPLTWDSPAGIAFDPADSLGTSDLHVVVRYNGSFREDTLTLRIATCSPDSLRCEETLLLRIPPARTAAPLRSEYRIPYRRRVRFGRSAGYRMTFTPTRPVRGIESVGLQIEKSR